MHVRYRPIHVENEIDSYGAQRIKNSDKPRLLN